MLEDARALAPDEVVDTDLCIVGGGPAGITLALELEAVGFRVCLLESGGTDPDRAGQELTRGENVDRDYYRLERTRVRAFGGSSHWWMSPGMRARPLDPLDFEERPEIGRIGWPFSREELDPFYARAQAYCGLGPFDYEVERWQDRPSGAQPLPVSEDLTETVMFQLAPLERWRSRLDDVRAAANVRVLLHATVQELVTDAAGTRIESVRVATTPDRSFTVRAAVTVLAAGGIENARMLLLSRNGRGIGNGNDHVGRYLMEHPHIRTGVVVPTDSSLLQRTRLYLAGTGNGGSRLGMLKPSDAMLREEGILATAWALHPTTDVLTSDVSRALVGLRELGPHRRILPHTGKRVATLVRNPAGVLRSVRSGRGRRRDVEATEQSTLYLAVMLEQAPNPSSRVTLGRRKDRFGQPVPRVEWRLSDLDHRSIRRGQEILDTALRQSGLGHIAHLWGEEDPPPPINGGFHHIGTTRMAAAEQHGVVDPDARVYGIANLYVTGMSVFPTAGYANPTRTVVAMAIRLADHLRERSRGGF
jgi:choline dehydrogenase-like flavoprotein